MTVEGYSLFWGDLHTHLEDFDAGERILREASENIDFTVVLLYPFVYESINGFRVESTGNRPEFQDQWQRINTLSAAWNQPHRFTTFPGYEWHGNRTRYGDHNVIYFEEGQPLDAAWSLPELYANLKSRKAMALPHHTGYLVGARGKDWGVFDESLSPVMEIFSQHGSSEGIETPHFMAHNASMGPGASGGTFQDALKRGVRVGVIGSNDGPGLPGRWGLGRAAVWARENTRASLWEAILARRTYAVTGDRIRLDYSVNGTPMGGQLTVRDAIDAQVSVVGSSAIDRIELVCNSTVIETYSHHPKPDALRAFPSRVKVFVRAGWGPASHNGFQFTADSCAWNGKLHVQDGRLVGIEKCYSRLGQSISAFDGHSLAWTWETSVRAVRQPPGLWQGLVLEIDSTINTVLDLELEGERVTLALRELLDKAVLVPLMAESRALAQEQFGIAEGAVQNPDAFYQNARKLVIHRAIPSDDYGATHTFRAVTLPAGVNALYVRVTQRNGQMAWSSPIWVEVRPGG